MNDELIDHYIEVKSDDGITSHVYLDGKEVQCRSYKIKHSAMKPIIVVLEVYCLGGLDVTGIVEKKNRNIIFRFFLGILCGLRNCYDTGISHLKCYLNSYRRKE